MNIEIYGCKPEGNFCKYKGKNIKIEDTSKYRISFIFKKHYDGIESSVLRTCFISYREYSQKMNKFVIGLSLKCNGKINKWERVEPEKWEIDKFGGFLSDMKEFNKTNNRLPSKKEIIDILNTKYGAGVQIMLNKKYHFNDYRQKCINKNHYTLSMNGHSMEMNFYQDLFIEFKIGKSSCWITDTKKGNINCTQYSTINLKQ